MQRIKDDTPPTATQTIITAADKQCISDSITVLDNFAAVNALGYGIEDNCTKVNFTIEGVTRTVKHNDMCNDSIIIKYTIADSCGNTKDVWHVQRIKDDTPPTATQTIITAADKQCISDSITVLDNFAAVNALGYGIEDNCTKVNFTIEGVTRTVKHNDRCNDSIIIKYTIADSCGNTKEVWHVQRIKDDTPPTSAHDTVVADAKQCLGDSITVLDNFAAVNVLGYGIEDNCTKVNFTLEGVTRTVKHNDMCNDSIIIKYTIADSCGNTKDVWHVQKIQDTDAPVAHNAAMSHDTLWVTGTECLKDSITTLSTIADVVTLFDIDDNCTKVNFQLKSTSNVLKTGENCADTVVIKYVVADSCNNEATFYHAQPIQDVTPPTAEHDTIIASAGQCIETDSILVRNDFATVNALGFGIEDNCTKVNFTLQGVERTVRHTDPCTDSVIIKYTVADSCGNTKNVWHIQQIKDEQAPTLKTPGTWPDDVTGQNVCVASSDLSVFLSESAAADLFEDCNTVTVTYTQDTTVNVCDWTVRRMYVIADACDNKTYDTIKVSGTNKVELTMSPDTTICLGGTANLRSTATVCSGDATYQWTSESANNGMPGTTNTNNISVMPTSPGVMTYTDTAYDANGCKTVESITVNVIDTASLSATNTIQASICVGGNIAPIAIEYSNATLDYEYNSVSGTLPPGLDITTHGNGKDTITGSITGATIGDIYTFSIIADNADNCGDKVITCTITITNGTKVYDTVTGCGSYTWTSAANPSEDETFDVTGPHDRIFGPYTSVSGCDSSFYLHVVIYDLPTPTMDNDTVCVGSEATLAVNQTYAHYDWGNGVDRRDSTVTTTDAGETTYIVTVTDEHNCSADAIAKIVVKDTVSLRVINGEQTLCLGKEMDTVKIIHYHCSVDSLNVPAGLTLNLTFNDSTAIITGTPTATYKDTVYGNSHEENVTCDQKSSIITITVNEPGDAGLPATATLCASSSGTNNSVTITSSLSTDDYDFTWTATGATPSSATNVNSVTLSYDADGDYEVTVIAEDKITHCLAYDTTRVHVNAVTIPIIAGRSTICDGETDTLTTTVDFAGYEWIGQSSTYDTLFVTAAGDYTVVGTDANGCSDTSAVFHVDVLDPITITENSKDTTYCFGATADSLSFTAHGGNGTYSYQWYVSTNGGSYVELTGATDSVYTPATTAAGTYSYKVEVTGECGPVEQEIAVVGVRQPFIVSEAIADDALCLDATAGEIAATVTGGTGVYDFLWEVSTDSSAYATAGTDSIYIPETNTAGTYYYRLTVTDSLCGDTTLHVQKLIVKPNVGLELVGDLNQTKCIGGNIDSVRVVATNAASVDVTADHGITPTYNTNTGNIGFTTAGNENDVITVTVTAHHDENSCDDSTLTFQVTLSAQTVANLTREGCESFHWLTANEDRLFTANKDTVIGPYISTEGCDSITNLHVVIYDLPTPTMDNDTVCVGSDATLTVNETFAHYDWGNGVDRRDSTVTTTAAGETTYTVTVTDEHNCSADVQAKIVVHDTLVPIFVADPNDTVCAGNAVTVSETSGNRTDYTYSIAYMAADGTNAVASDSTVTVTYTTAGTYYFDFTITNDTTNCVSHKRDTIVVLPKVGLELTGNLDQQVCVGSDIDSVTVTATNAASVDVSANQGITPTYNETTGNIGFTAAGNENDVITVTVVAHHDENSCDDSTLTFQVTLSSTRVVNITREACGSFHWQTANEDRLFTESKDTVIGPYPAANGCDSITNLSVVINSNLTPTINGRTHICQGDTDTLTLTATYDEYEWSDGSHGDTLFVTAGGPYSVEVRDVHGCTGTANITVTIDTLPVPVIAGETTICDGETDTLTVTVDYNSYLWTGGSTYDTLFATSEGDYTVTVTDGNGCEGTSAVFHVDVLDPITITENSKDTTYCFGDTADSLSFTAHGGNGTYSYQWYVSTDGGTSYAEINGATDTVYTPATTAANTYTYKVEVTGECGPVEQVIAVVGVRQPLAVTEAIADDALCLDATATEIGATVTGGTGVYDFVWEVSTDSANYTTASTDSAYVPETTTAGTYYYRLTVTDSLCGDTTLHVQKLVVKPNVGLELVGDLNQTKCIGGSIDSVMVVATNAASVEVTADHGITPTYNTTTGNIGFATAGNENDVITVTVVAHHDENSCDDSTLTFQVTLSALTTKNLTVSGCGSYHWVTANEDTLFTATTDTIIGPYPSANGCDSMTYLHVDVNGGEMPVFSLPEDVCVTASETNDSIEISVQALTGYTYVWDIDGGVRAASSPLASDGVSDTNVVVVRWADDGDKTVSVTLTSLENSCTGTDSKTIHVHAVPAISIAAVTGDICPYVGSQTLTATVDPATAADYTYTWGGGLTVTTDNATTDATTSEATATIPTSPCDTTYNVGVSVTDGNGCTATADSVTLTVRDVTAPTYDKPNDTTIYKDATCNADITPEALGTVSNVVEGCSPDVDTSYTDVVVTPATACMGTTVIERRWRVVDLCGNVSTSDSVQTITILDTVAPIIEGTMAEVTVEGCDESAVPAVASTDTTIAYMLSQGVTSVTDNCSDEAHLTVSISDGAMTGDCDHEVIRTYTVTDDCGNSSSTTQTFTITRPAFVVPAMDTTTVVCENDATAPMPAAVTLCGNEYTAQPVNTGDTNRVTETVAGYLYITYNYEYTDCKGSYAWHKTYKLTPGEFTPVDSVYDVVACPSDIDSIPVPTVIVCGDTVPFTFTTANSSDTARCGDSIYNYTYTVNGTTYNWAYIVRFEPGDFTMPDDDSVVVHCPSAIVLPNTVAGRMPEVHNACGEDISDQYALASQPDEIPTCEGRAVYTYSYTDCAGHSHEWHFTYILEREDFTIAAEPGSATVACAAEALGAGEAGSVVTLPTVMAMCDGEPPLMPIDTIEGQMPSCDGVMTYTYRYNDCTGNHQHDWVFTYTVRDSIAPTIAPIADRMADAGGGCEYVIPDLSSEVNATDNCGETHFMGQTPTAGTRYQQTESQQQVEVIVQVDDDCENHGYDTVIVTIPARNPNVTVNPTNPSICYGDTVTLTANGTSSATGEGSYRWNPINGLDASTGATVHAFPTTPMTYTVTYTDGNGCEASASAVVTVNPQSTLEAENLNQEVCVGGSITNIVIGYTNSTITISGLPNGLTYRPATATISGRPTESGTFTITATSNYGCPEKTLTGTITVDDTVTTTSDIVACDSYVWPVNNGTYATSGRYRQLITASDGCISAEYLNLTINHRSYGVDEVSACDEFTWTNGNGQTYTSSTSTPTYTIQNGNAVGCDSITTLHLTMHYSNNTETSESACDSYTWFGTTYTNSTDATFTTQNRWGCDSTVVLHLTVNPSYHFEPDNDSICAGESVSYHGNQYSSTGNYTVTLRTRAGCDSVYTLHLTVLQPQTVSIEKDENCLTGSYTLTAITESEFYMWSETPDRGQVEPQATQKSIEVAPPATTTYTVTVGYGDNLICPQSASITLDEFITPTAIITTRPAHLSFDHPEWFADDQSTGATGREWYVDGEVYWQQTQHINGAIEANPYDDNDSVTLTLIVYNDRCADTAEVVIPLIRSEIWVPNVFTPSLDINNLFGAEGVGIIEYEIWIYNREGLRVFHSDDMTVKWDGKHEGTDTDCKQDAYTWRIDYRFASKPEELQTKVGLVLLLR
ncbi:MAG: gliding motility-associated C-terminal domain-containing protein [Bacteroidales bacterium]|nr:gliding motility-associated C-terminal domain-containing protein [Bacteroidales bacterium]